jgi:hypothetical protein
MAKDSYTHVVSNGRVEVRKLPKGSTEDAASFKENMLGVAAKAALGKVFGGKR